MVVSVRVKKILYVVVPDWQEFDSRRWGWTIVDWEAFLLDDAVGQVYWTVAHDRFYFIFSDMG